MENETVTENEMESPLEMMEEITEIPVDGTDTFKHQLIIVRNHGREKWYRQRKYIFTLLLVVFILGCAAAIIYYVPKHENSVRTGHEPWKNMRLPETIVPVTYHLKLFVDMCNDTYVGNVTIDVVVRRHTNWILLHAIDLDIDRVIIENLSKKNFVITKSFMYNPNEFYVIQTSVSLQKDHRYAIVLYFKGKMRNDLSGLYTSYYNDGDTKYKVASTFFSPISARSAFPCFDEPKFKANFTLTLTHSDGYHALSNMPARTTFTTINNDKRQTTNDRLITTAFYPSLKMSTYIVCWIISNFSYIESNVSYPKLRAWGPAHNTEELRYSLDITYKLLRFYESYFQIPYPLEKLDTFAVPNLGPGAMENWGLITYRSQIIRHSRSKSTTEEIQQTVNVVAHELVHQWFGNLVTMDFWTDAWLKEGFANDIAILGADKIDKSLNLRQQMLTNLMLAALEEDSYASSQPISSPPQTPNEVREVFNIITYNKGSCIVEMLNQYLGADIFRKGLQQYLRVYSYSTANQDNLWQQLSDVSHKDVKSVMDTWTLQLGYPVVSLTRVDNTTIEISQTRFSLDPHHITPPRSPFDYVWKIPLIFEDPITKNRTKYLLVDQKVKIDIPRDFSILNPGHSFFYRVHYNTNMLHTIKQLLMNDMYKLTPQDRTGIISDQFNLVKFELVNIADVLDLLKYLNNEIDYFPWLVAFDCISYMQLVIDDVDTHQQYNSYIRNISQRITSIVEWNKPNTTNGRSLQVLILKEACIHNMTDKIEEAKELFVKWMDGDELDIRPSLFPVVWGCAISHGPQSFWEHNFEKYKEGGAYKESLLMSLAATRNRDTIQTLLEYSLDKNIIESQDAPYVISTLAKSSKLARHICWQFLEKNWNHIIETYGNEVFLLANMIQGVLENLSSEDDLFQVESFFNSTQYVGSGQQAVKQSINKIKLNIHWKGKHLSGLWSWLSKEGY